MEAKLAIAEQYVEEFNEGEYDGTRYRLVIILEDGTKLIRQLYREEE